MPSLNRIVLAIHAGLSLLMLARPVDASAIYGVNHTHWAINRLSVDGRSAVDSIGPHQGGGGGCCYMVPDQWRPGMMVRVDWETGVGGSKGFPGFADESKYDAWLQQIEAQKRKHSKVVPVPDYTGQKVCGITVHFLPCDDIQVTTSCYAYGNPEYPIKIPLELPEPQSCPAQRTDQQTAY
ncbi:DUF3304 domain-containing protein [Stenotrophomonas maltophilia]|uniref:DUF3304 domain-containing protein n=1 Tax=Stenotrophomonas maltophilia TaxID=40324 RepID=UPI0012FE24E0|nr:DUF3304 domain-containing protein [Stenotrophomonas maltophilia]